MNMERRIDKLISKWTVAALVAAAVLSSSYGFATPTYHVVTPIDDVFASGLSRAGNSGQLYYLYTSATVGPVVSYLKFQLETEGAFDYSDSALEIYCFYGYNVWVDLFLIEEDEWTENAVNWYNQPGGGIPGPQLAESHLQYPWTPMRFELDDALVNAAADDGYLSIMIKPRSKDAIFYSAENIDQYKPRLSYYASPKTLPTPLPGGWSVIVTGLVALIGLGRFTGK
jgi:hypothetical protein